MTDDQTANLLYAVLVLMLVGSGLFARRIPWRSAWKMALAWVAIFGVIFVLFAFREDMAGVWSRLWAAADPQGGTVSGGVLRVPMNEDGHFYVRAKVNGTEASFLVDSGATTMALSAALVDRAGIMVDASGFGVAIGTANGTVMARRIRIDRFELGPIAREDLAAITAPEFGDTNIVGMNFLSSLSSWRVEGRTLVLTP